MSIFKHRRDLGQLLLGIWLITWGLRSLLGLSFLFLSEIQAGVAIAAGVLIIRDR